MCRILVVKSKEMFEMKTYLKKFSKMSKNSKEYQGHGWGCAFLKESKWIIYKNINPIWKDDFSKFGRTNLLVAHARSAFNNEGVKIENNMPFYDGEFVFVFNGELRGVKIKENGKIGAEKIFNFIKRFNKSNFFESLKRGVELIRKNSSYIRAFNLIIANKEKIYLVSFFNEEPDYFTLKMKKGDPLVICSEDLGKNWKEIKNNTITEIK